MSYEFLFNDRDLGNVLSSPLVGNFNDTKKILMSHSRSPASSRLNSILIFMTRISITLKIMHSTHMNETNWLFSSLSLQRDSVCISLLHRTRLEFFSYKLQWRWCRLCSRSTRKSFESESIFFYLFVFYFVVDFLMWGNFVRIYFEGCSDATSFKLGIFEPKPPLECISLAL